MGIRTAVTLDEDVLERVKRESPRHAEMLGRLLVECRAGSPWVSDAVMAAMALEYGATLASADRDFSRFPSLRWVNPAA